MHISFQQYLEQVTQPRQRQSPQLRHDNAEEGLHPAHTHGMGSFALAYAVEHARLKHSGDAAHIARGVVWAKLFVIFLKVCATLGMSGFLLYRLHFGG